MIVTLDKTRDYIEYKFLYLLNVNKFPSAITVKIEFFSLIMIKTETEFSSLIIVIDGKKDIPDVYYNIFCRKIIVIFINFFIILNCTFYFFIDLTEYLCTKNYKNANYSCICISEYYIP